MLEKCGAGGCVCGGEIFFVKFSTILFFYQIDAKIIAKYLFIQKHKNVSGIKKRKEMRGIGRGRFSVDDFNFVFISVL